VRTDQRFEFARRTQGKREGTRANHIRHKTKDAQKGIILKTKHGGDESRIQKGNWFDSLAHEEPSFLRGGGRSTKEAEATLDSTVKQMKKKLPGRPRDERSRKIRLQK